MYNPDNGYCVYCLDCFASDKWDPFFYGMDYDFSRPFFEQLQFLFKKIPRRALYQDFATNSIYTNYAVYMKDSYLTFGGHHYENCSYCCQSFYLTDCLDVDFSMKSEFCYFSSYLKRCSRVFFSQYSEDCLDSWFLFGCRNCTNCISCTNLRNSTYCIFNEQYSKEEYKKKKEQLNLDSWTNFKEFEKDFVSRSLKFPRKYAQIKNIVDSTGNDLENVKNCRYCFSATEDENCRYSFFMPTGAKNVYDVDHTGIGAEDTLELHSGFGVSNVLFGNRIYYSHHICYSDDCYNSSYLFGCAGIRKKEYCILNKQYTKKEYEELSSKIIKQMAVMPYNDNNNLYSFGEYFPPSIMPFAYNECVAQEYFTTVKEQILKQGFRWADEKKREYKIDLQADEIPESLQEIDNSILNKIIGCAHKGECNEQCTTAFKITKQELGFLKRFGLPLPHLCPNCRHFERLNNCTPPKLWHRKCMKEGCTNEFETSYAPDRPEIIYCEKCYQKEVI
jgi:hypothetical protein